MRLSRRLPVFVLVGLVAMLAPAPAPAAAYSVIGDARRCVFGGGYWAPGSFANVSVCDYAGGTVYGTDSTGPNFTEQTDQWCIFVYKAGSPSVSHSGCATSAPATALIFDPLLEHATVQFSVVSGGGILTANLSLTGSGARRVDHYESQWGTVEDPPYLEQSVYANLAVRRNMTIDPGSFITSTLATGGVITSGGASVEIDGEVNPLVFGP